MGNEAVQIIIPDRGFVYVNNILKEAKIGSISHYKKPFIIEAY
jgi:hypothetical protein